MNDIQLIETKKDHYKLMVNGVDAFGEQERSTWRHLIEVVDNKIYNY